MFIDDVIFLCHMQRWHGGVVGRNALRRMGCHLYDDDRTITLR